MYWTHMKHLVEMVTSNDRMLACNSTYKKLAVQCLNEVLCFVSSSVLEDSLVLQNRQLLVAAKRYSLLPSTDLLKNQPADNRH